MQDDNLKILRHSAAHLAAHAIKELYPDTLLTIGPATQDGFFYDVLPKKNFKEEDLKSIEDRMRELSQKNFKIEHKQISKEEARKIFANNIFKLELIDQIPAQTVGLSIQGDFVDLCAGGHVKSTGEIKYFKLLSISGSYWRADKSKQALQRISGTAFFTEQELKDYEKLHEEMQTYDHRKLGKQLDLFSFHEEGVGFPFFHPKGKRIINKMVEYMRKIHIEHNYQEVSTPTMLSEDLWKRSGHYEHFRQNMYFSEVENKTYAIKPMNCPGGILIYKNRPHSYRELPLKLAEFGHVHRHELSGVLHGLLRVRAFTQDDAHIFCTTEQIEHEVINIIKIIKNTLNKFGFIDLKFAVSTRPENAMGSTVLWEEATNSLINALNTTNTPFKIQEGEGAFYGPKIEVVIQDCMNRQWQCGTVQVDFFLPENFDLTYVTSEGKHERPVIIHQAIYGSLERFFAIILEHYKGHLPFWLAPVGIKVLPITDKQLDYAKKIYNLFKDAGIYSQLDESSDPLSAKIKSAQLEKIPIMLILGAKEEANNTVTIRYNDGKQENGISIDQALEIAVKLNS